MAKLLVEVLKPAVVGESRGRFGGLGDVLRACGDRVCLVVVEDAGRVFELVVSGGGVVAARVVDGGVVYGEDVVRMVERLGGFEARVFVLRDSIYEWRDDLFTVGIRGIDLQHRQLVKALNALYRALLSGRASHAYETLVFMGEYAGFHFSTEERLFDRYGYPRADEHRRAHAAFIEKTGEFKRLLGEAGVDAAIEMVVFLADWVKAHILGMDRDYARWLGRVK